MCLNVKYGIATSSVFNFPMPAIIIVIQQQAAHPAASIKYI